MRRFGTTVLILGILAIGGLTTARAQDEKKALTPGNDVPGPFHPFNVTGKRKDNFHCLVSQQGLDPSVMIFTTDLQFSDPLKDLLKKLDDAVEKNPNERLLAFVVFLPEDLKDVVTDDNERNAYRAKVAALANELGLKHVILTLFSRKYLDRYPIDPAAQATVILCHKFTILSTHSLGSLTAEKVTEIRKDVADKLGAKRE